MRLSSEASEGPGAGGRRLSLGTASNDSVFHPDVPELDRAEINTPDDATRDENSNTQLKNILNEQDAVNEHLITKVAVKPSSPYELLTGTTGPKESYV